MCGDSTSVAGSSAGSGTAQGRYYGLPATRASTSQCLDTGVGPTQGSAAVHQGKTQRSYSSEGGNWTASKGNLHDGYPVPQTGSERFVVVDAEQTSWVLGGCREKEGFLSLLFSSLIACTGMSEVVTFRFFGRFLWLWNVWSGVNMGALPGLSSSAWGISGSLFFFTLGFMTSSKF
jgi:hypothetical protein